IDIACPADADCRGGGGASVLKVTQLDVSIDPPRVERERYYEGSYVSSRRYTAEASDLVRVVVQSTTAYQNLYAPELDWFDAWGRKYAPDVIDGQLAAWEARQTSAIRATTLSDWLPKAWEKQNGARVEISPACESYYVPVAGLADYGLTQVLGIDMRQPSAAATGVTIVGATSTVYSNWNRLVLAQPDYRWSSTARDFGMLTEQRTALHTFELGGATTRYLASGWVPGHLPPHNPQFGIDVAADGTVRVATTGDVRDDPNAKPSTPAFWAQHPETRVITARADGTQLREVGRSRDLGLPRERVQSARFVGNRAYVVTFLQTDPLVVVDVANAASPTVLGEIKIPGFSQYMHPLDENHLITVGQSAQRGIQLQLFDVTNPASIPAPKVHDFGSGSSSEASYSHKAFTFYDGILAVPVSGAWASQDYRYRYYTSALQLLRVDPQSGFTFLGAVDHAPLYADNGAGVKCGVCDAVGCYAYACGYAPEVRRGHFVKADAKTYVYSFSHAGVLVHDLASLVAPLARVGLPAPQFDYGYGVRTSSGSAGKPVVDLPAASPTSAPTTR
ncbi:MAG: beta-propeller domain-containing protein, partial [Polyangiales bacterium]